MGSATPVQNLKGFRDFIGVEKDARDYLMGKLRSIFKKYGFTALETPTLEYAELLLGKYGEEADKLMYSFEDKGGRSVALRYDQTVPSARILSQYQDKLPKYYRRYQMQNVFRAEKPQKGRYREFMQCDIDIFGSKSWLADAEVLACAYDAFLAIGFNDIEVRINDRSLLMSVLSKYADDQIDVYSIIQSVDKLDKLSENQVIEELVNKGLPNDKAAEALDTIKQAKPTDALETLIMQAKALGIKEDAMVFTPTLARGLNYYTGAIFEFVCPRFTAGSLGGGGRYDDLIGQLSGSTIPATGFAFGFDRIVAAMTELNLLPTFEMQELVLVSVFDDESLPYSLSIAKSLRNEGIRTLVYPQSGDKLDKQLKYAEQVNAKFVIIAGSEERETNSVQLKDLATRSQQKIAANELAAKIKLSQAN